MIFRGTRNLIPMFIVQGHPTNLRKRSAGRLRQAVVTKAQRWRGVVQICSDENTEFVLVIVCIQIFWLLLKAGNGKYKPLLGPY